MWDCWLCSHCCRRYARSGQDKAIASAAIDINRTGATIAPEIYGQFAEHLGGCVYGGLWVGEDSDIPNQQGYRRDVLSALKKLRVPVLRWPGGCFADDYHWRDGIGPKNKRPRTINIYWGNVEDDNSFGTHEFLNLCELLECEAYVAGNVGSGSVEEMRQWVEYMTSDSNSTMAELRRANGRDKPWRVRYFGIGNENWGCGGNMTAEYYADLYRRYATYVRNFSGNRIVKIACGPSGRDVPWMDTVIREVQDHMHAISMHYYVLPTGDWSKKGAATGFQESEWFSVVRRSFAMEDLINEYEAILDEVDADKKLALYVDEWGTWYDAAPDSKSALFQQNTIRDAVSAAICLNIFHEHSDRIRMSNIAQVVNVLQAMILTDDKDMVLTPTYHVFEMYNVHQGAKHLPLKLAAPSYVLGDEQVPAVSLTASINEQGEVHVSIANTDPQREAELSFELKGMNAKTVTGRVLSGTAMDSRNDFGSPEVVTPASLNSISLRDQTVTVTVPSKSVSVLKIH